MSDKEKGNTFRDKANYPGPETLLHPSTCLESIEHWGKKIH